MKKPYFTRKNLIVLSLAIFYGLIVAFAGVCTDAAHAVMPKNNLLFKVFTVLGFTPIQCSLVGYVGLMLLALYIVLFVASVLYIRRYAINNKVAKNSPKLWGAYVCAFLICLLLSFGFTILFVTPKTWENISNTLTFLGQSFLFGTLIFIVLSALIGGIAMLVVNFILIDKPFRFSKEMEELDIAEDVDPVDVTASFDAHANVNEELATASTGGAAASNGGAGGNSTMSGGEFTPVKGAEQLADRNIVFPSLTAMDVHYNAFVNEKLPSDQTTLTELCDRFRNYLAAKEGLYFDEETIRLFVSGFAASHFLILEGLSGTGKSSLPRYFAKFLNGNVLFMPVQATWRDKSNILGFFNEFSKTYNETDFLTQLYHAVYNPDQMHIFVLDEMNISRVEYYFADLLSVLEYPQEDWKLRLMQFPHDFLPPAKIEDGFIQIMPNCYFVGTANKDDSTFSISDKVYDRAITMEFDYRNKAFKPEGNCEGMSVSASYLQGLFEDSFKIKENCLNDYDLAKFETLTEFVYDQFSITFGNRIMAQIEKLVPAYVACGGKKEEALDFIFARKVLSKVDGRFEEYVKGALKQLLALIHKTYGAGVFKRSERAITQLIKKL